MGYILELRKAVGSRPLITAGAGVILVNGQNEILLHQRRDNGYWDYPAGSMEPGESFADCARREVLEETGLTCGRLEFFKELSGQDTFYTYPNGDQVYLACILYLCRDFTGEMKVQADEVITQRFFPAGALPEQIPPFRKKLFADIRAFLLRESSQTE